MQLTDIKQIGVVGAGTMGFGIAINFALWGYQVTISDLSEELLNKSLHNVVHALELFVEGGLIDRQRADATLSRIDTTTDVAELAAKSDFVTEAIVERLGDKQALFQQLDQLCPPHTILATNTSGFVLSDIGAGLQRQEKLVLTHYFAPPHIVPGVEVAKGPGTTEETFDLTCELLAGVKKIPIRLRKELPGYLLNRIQSAMGREALALWSEGMASAEDIELGIISTFGFRMPHEGPFRHYDLAGIWKWPADVLSRRPSDNEKIRARMAERKPWFVDPEKFDEAVEKRDREYIRRLKELYWANGE
ncbi:MAG: 3-hydroxyacyl-CoA dehydrogenase family protein [Caldilineaceae bacterium]|nr:3-hydroxyacyl-CoA dehydrogenase family protein [Caldilineaceae bacterium]